MLFLNTYPKDRVSFLEGIYKNLRYQFYKYQNYKVHGRHMNALFYPEYPKSGSTAARTLRSMNINITNNPAEGYDFVFFWIDETETVNVDKILQPLNLNYKAFNQDCLDISKTKVDKVFEEVFGYSITVDPLKHEGRCVQKCDENALGEIDEVECPLPAAKPGFVYQKIIDNTVNEDYIADLRVLIFGTDIPFIIDKWIPKVRRYKKPTSTTLDYKYHRKATKDVLSKEEQANVIEMAKRMGLDYGEMDILRDNKDGKIYIVDVNKTPTMTIKRFTEQEQKIVYADLQHYFKKNFITSRQKK